MKAIPQTIAALVGLSTIVSPLMAQDSVEPSPPKLSDHPPLLEALTVIGSKEDVYTLPGSGYVIDSEEIRSQNYSNVNRVLAKVPGVYVREEDGFGNFPNISLRGADGTRSEKTTIMEDGILSAPATYSAPGAYYSPRAGRMHGIDVLKGSSQINYGPHTTGGVINYRSTPIPDESTLHGRYTYGSDSTMLAHAYYGDQVETESGKFGYLFEIFGQRSDGFRTIQPGQRYAGSDSTGFSVYEPMVKLSWEPNTAVPQRLEIKYGYTDLDADESYAGLSERDVVQHPDWRYAATRFDNIQSEHHRSYVKYVIEPSDSFRVEAAGYYNEFTRNWYKLDGVTIENGPSSVRAALLDPRGLSFLQGRGAGSGLVRANNRDYQLYGFQLAGDWNFATGGIDHEMNFGARVHRDEERRYQRDDRFVQDDSGAITEFITGEDGSGGHRFQESTAIALWLQDTISLGPLSIIPGVRFETIDQHYVDYASNSSGTRTASDEGRIDFVAPGISFRLDLSDTEQLFGGVYKGVSAPGPRASLRTDIDLEKSIGYEFGFRTQRDNGFNVELVGFLTDFDSLIGTDTGFGDTNEERNAGKATVWGVEGALRYDPLEGRDLDLSIPLYVTATWTSAEFDSDLASGGGDGIYDGARDGNEIPYIPELQLAVGIGLKTTRWGTNLDLTYHSSSLGTGDNVSAPLVSARQGKIDDLLLLDLSAHYQITDQVKLIGGISNLTDERGIVSRVPRGPRANQGRQYWLGAEFNY